MSPLTRTIAVSLTLVFGAAAPVVAAEAPPAEETTAEAPEERAAEGRPKIGLVLGGGGARGLAHVGVLKVLEELQIPVDVIAGTSMGAIVGGLYASGYSPDEIDRAVGEIDWDRAFLDRPARKDLSFRRKEDDNDALLPVEVGIGRQGFSVKSGAVAGQRINFILRSLTLHTKGTESFDDLSIPFRAVAADLETGEAVPLDRGELSTAMRASMAIPAVFTPVEIDGRFFVDGGLIKNLPVDVVMDLGADIVIAVDVGNDPEKIGENLSALEVASRSISVLRRRDLLAQRALIGEDDFLIEPDMGKMSVADFADWRYAIETGESSARAEGGRLASLGVSDEEWSAFVARHRHSRDEKLEQIVVDRIEVRGVEPLDPRVVERRLDSRTGRPIRLNDVAHDLLMIDQLGEYETVAYDVEEGDDGATVLSMTAQRKGWGPGYLRFGIFVESDFEGDSEIGIIANFRLTEINRLGAEWRTIARIGEPLTFRTEFFQPLNRKRYWFVAPIFELSQDQDRRVIETGDVEVVDRDEVFGELDVGAQLGNWGEVRVGARAGRFDTESVTTSRFEPFEADTGGWVFRAVVDEFDSAFFPRSGVRARIDLYSSRDSLGADFEYDRLDLSYTQVGSAGKNVFLGALQLGSGLGSNIPFYDNFELGGFFRLSGIEQGALQDDAYTLATFIYYREVFELGPLGQVYAGVGLQAGNVWPDLGEFEFDEKVISTTLFAGLDTPLVPVYLGYGLAEGGEHEAYLFIGQAF